MALRRFHSFLVIAGVAAVPSIMGAAWMSIYSPWLGFDDQFIAEPKVLNAVQFALATRSAIGTAALNFWVADNIRPIPFMSRKGVASFLAVAIGCACFSIVLALVELILTFQYYVGEDGEGWVSIVGYSLWSAVATLVFLPVLLFARAQAQLRLRNAPLASSPIVSTFE